MITLNDLKKSHPDLAGELWQLYELRGVKGGEALSKRRALRKTLRNAGILSLPFSMNVKK